MASITASGTGSGLDVENIITKLTAAEKEPTEKRLDLRDTEVKAKITAFGSLKSELSGFQSSLSSLKNMQSMAARKATSNEEELFTATADNNANVGQYQIQTKRMATSHKLVSGQAYSGPAAELGAGELSISVGDKQFSVNIVSSNNSLKDVRDAINQTPANPGVQATILQVSDGNGGTESRLMLTAAETGAKHRISIAITKDVDGDTSDANGLSALLFKPDGTGNMEEKAPPEDALISVDGYDVTSSTNRFEDVIEGVTIDLKKVDTEKTGSLSVAQDTSAMVEGVEKFVEAYNKLNDKMRYLTKYDPNTREAGLLTGDFAVRTIETQLRRVMGSVIDVDNKKISSFANLGIETQRNGNGSLLLNKSELTKAVNKDPDAVAEFLAGKEGVAKRLDKKVYEFLKKDGLLYTRNATFKKQEADISEQKIKLNARMESLEQRLRAQYGAMDLLVSQLKSTGEYVTQQMDTLISGLTKK